MIFGYDSTVLGTAVLVPPETCGPVVSLWVK